MSHRKLPDTSIWIRRGEHEFHIDGQTLKRNAIGRRGWTCTEHGAVQPSRMFRNGQEFMVCWQCVHTKLNITEAIRIDRDTQHPPESRGNFD